MTFLMKKKYIYLISHAAHTTKLKIDLTNRFHITVRLFTDDVKMW